MAVLTVCYALLFVFLIICRYVEKMKRYYMLAKLLASAGFIAIAVYAFFEKHDLSFFYSLLPALLLYLIGDLLMAAEKRRDGTKYFIAAGIIFAFAHIVLYVGLSFAVKLSIFELIIPLGCATAVYAMSKLKGISVGKLTLPLVAYAFVVSLPVSKGMISVILNGVYPLAVLMTLGGALLVLSDTMLFFDHFYRNTLGADLHRFRLNSVPVQYAFDHFKRAGRCARYVRAAV